MNKNLACMLMPVLSFCFPPFGGIEGGFAQGNYQGKLGYGFSPKGHPYDYSKMADFLQAVANTCGGGIVFANASWRNSYSSSGIIPSFQKTISLLQPGNFGYVDMIDFGWGTSTTPYTLYLNVPGDTTNNWSNATARSLFLQMLINAADSLQPTYMFLGNEISFFYAQDSTDYMNYVAFYHEAYDSIKVHSPSTKVGTVFNYEHLSGNGSLIGWSNSYWNALTVFDTSKVDVFGFTVYPFFNYQTASAVPDTYLDTVFNMLGNKPIAITETGWPADSILANWYCSPQQQVDYVNKIFTVINGQNVEVVNWLFLYYLMDQSTDENKFACSIALYDSLGNPQPALPVWLSYCDTVTVTGKMIADGDNMEVFPNPCTNRITIRNSKNNIQNGELEIFDVFGRKIFSSDFLFPASDFSFDFPNGVYYLKIKSENNSFMKNLLIR